MTLDLQEAHKEELGRLALVPNLRFVEMPGSCNNCLYFYSRDEVRHSGCAKYLVPVEPENICDSYEPE